MSAMTFPIHGRCGSHRGPHLRHQLLAMRGSFGFPPGFGPPWGGGPGPRGRHHRGGRARRGDARLAALLLLAEEPRNGYGLMQEIEARSEGVWRPSPGSIYPALQQLEDEGLIRSEERDGRRVYVLTDAGRAEIDARDPEAPAPWEEAGEGVPGSARAMWEPLRGIAVALSQVAQAGTPAQGERAREILEETRRSLYRLLAEDEGTV